MINGKMKLEFRVLRAIEKKRVVIGEVRINSI